MRRLPRAAHVTKLDIVNTRVAVVSMEPRVALAAFDKAAERFTLQVPTQGVVRQQGDAWQKSSTCRPTRFAF